VLLCEVPKKGQEEIKCLYDLQKKSNYTEKTQRRHRETQRDIEDIEEYSKRHREISLYTRVKNENF